MTKLKPFLSQITLFLLKSVVESGADAISSPLSIPNAATVSERGLLTTTTSLLPCENWCDAHPRSWIAKCQWKSDCGGCQECSFIRAPDPITRPVVPPPCLRWCVAHPKTWSVKCQWTVDCAGCRQCDESSAPSATPTSSTRDGGLLSCQTWCDGTDIPWEEKCWGEDCGGCPACTAVMTGEPTAAVTTPYPTYISSSISTTDLTSVASAPCFEYCYTLTNSWEEKCEWALNCAGCGECREGDALPSTTAPPTRRPVTALPTRRPVTAPPTRAPTIRDTPRPTKVVNRPPPTFQPVFRPTTRPRQVPTPAVSEYPCSSWCEGHVAVWDDKCQWKEYCAGCPPCRSSSDGDSNNCKNWCETHASSWEEKCQWEVNCAGCSTCFSTTSAPTLVYPCRSWCDSHGASWEEKCNWPYQCAGCAPCRRQNDGLSPVFREQNTSPPTSAQPCQTWCASHEKPWNEKCNWPYQCAGCAPCHEKDATRPTLVVNENTPPSAPTSVVTGPCKTWCASHEKSWDEKCNWPYQCAGCPSCHRGDDDGASPSKTMRSAPTKTAESDRRPTVEPTVEPVARCEKWCYRSDKSWERKCRRLKCQTCGECVD